MEKGDLLLRFFELTRCVLCKASSSWMKSATAGFWTVMLCIGQWQIRHNLHERYRVVLRKQGSDGLQMEQAANERIVSSDLLREISLWFAASFSMPR